MQPYECFPLDENFPEEAKPEPRQLTDEEKRMQAKTNEAVMRMLDGWLGGDIDEP